MSLVFFIIATFLTQITFLNMLIAIMGDTFSRISEVKEQSALHEKILILADFCIAVPRRSEVDDFKYMFRVLPLDVGTSEGANWEGTVATMKRNI